MVETYIKKVKGLLVDTYIYTDGSQETIFKWKTALIEIT